MKNRYADYIYENKKGTRINIHKYNLDTSERAWNVWWYEGGEHYSYSEWGDIFPTKHAARKWAETEFGPIKSINPKHSWVGA